MDRNRLLGGGPLVFQRKNKRTGEEVLVIVDESPRCWSSYLIYRVVDPTAEVLRPADEPMGALLHSELRVILGRRSWHVEVKKVKNDDGKVIERKTSVFDNNGSGETRNAWYLQVDRRAHGARRAARVE